MLNRAQPLGIISYFYMLSPLGIYLPSQSAVMIFQPVFFSLILVANLAFFTIIDWPEKKTKYRFSQLFFTYFVAVSTVIGIELPALYSHAGEAIFHEANTPNKKLEIISNELIPYAVLGNFAFDAYFFAMNKFSDRLARKHSMPCNYPINTLKTFSL